MGSRRARLASGFIALALMLDTGHAQSQRIGLLSAAKGSAPVDAATETDQVDAEAELQRGIALCRDGKFQEALSHLRLTQGKVKETYVASFNLALAYLGVGSYTESIRILNALRQSGGNTATVDNLLSQAYIGDDQQQEGFASLQAASSLTPRDESLYVYVADACTDHYDYALGLRVVDVGLQQLPASARLHYERAIFLASLDQLDEGRPEFERTISLAPGSDIAYLAEVQEALYDNHLQEATRIARAGIQAGHRDYQMLGLLGDILLRNGAIAGQPDFLEAKSLLEKSVAENPSFSTSQLTLGKVYLMEQNFREAVLHLEIAERLEPLNPAIYTNLGAAYRRLGDDAKARRCMVILAKLLQQKEAGK